MDRNNRAYTLPRWRVTRWLAHVGDDVPGDIRVALIGGLFGTLPVFAAGVINTVLVSTAIAIRNPTPYFIAWVVLELAVCFARLALLVTAHRAARKQRETPTDVHILLSVAWSGTVGYGVLVSFASGDWVAATVASLSAAAMVGGICFRNFVAPRLASTMIVVSLGPCLIGAACSGQPLLYIVFLQGPMYLVAMSAAAFKLNRMLVATMHAERLNEHRARHDQLTGVSNRLGLVESIEARRRHAGGAGRFALLLIDLDDFKNVNDTWGHAAGDRLLHTVGERLCGCLGPNDLAARIGGDEFAVLTDISEETEAIDLGERIVIALSTLYEFAEGKLGNIGLSVGIALSPEHGDTFEDLLAVADAALYEAKELGKSRCRMGSVTANVAALRRMRALTDAPSASAESAAA
jgi:diguanylate cyclase (GGDEF)-like protein